MKAEIAASGLLASGALNSPVTRETNTSEVARRLLGYVTSGELLPGQRLPSERQLADAFGVGRSTVREALAALDLLGIVAIRQGAGTYLKSDSSDLLPQAIDWGLMLGRQRTLDLVEARRYLECIITRLAAERLTEESLGRIKTRLDAMRDTVDDIDAFVEADIAFHLEVAAVAGNTVLAEMLNSVRSLLRVWITRAVNIDGITDNTLREHTEVYEAIASGDGAKAEAAMRNHMDCASARLTRSLQAESGPAELSES